MELQPETFKPPEFNSLPNPPEGVKVKLEIMQRVKGCGVHLAGEKQVAEIRPRTRPAGVAVTRRIGGAIVLGVLRVLNIDAALAGKELPVPAVPRRQHAVEQVDAPGHRFEEILRRPGP